MFPSVCASCIMLRQSTYGFPLSTLNFKKSITCYDYYGLNYYSKKSSLLSQVQLKRYCDLLGLPVNASEAKIKQEFYKKSMLFHPDKTKDPDSRHLFNLISEAYSKLIAHKRHSKTNVDNHHNPFWKKPGPNRVRPWYQSKNQPRTNRYTRKSETFDGKAFGDKYGPETEANNQQHSYASDWCDDYYKKQLKMDSIKHHRKKIQNFQIKKSSPPDDDKCSIM